MRIWLLTLATLLIPASAVYAAGTMNITNVNGLSFGSFAAGTGGTVTIAATGGRSKTGGVTLLSGGSGNAASFSVSGTPGSGTYTIQLPTSITLTATGGATMVVDSFTTSPSGTPPVTSTNSTLTVGARLTVGAGQSPAAYNGSFTITVTHN